MYGSGAVSCSCSLLIRGPILPAVRQKLHLSPCADSQSRLYPQKNVDKPNHPHRVLSRKTVYDVVVCDIAKCWNDPSHELSETTLVIRIIARHPKYGSRQ